MFVNVGPSMLEKSLLLLPPREDERSIADEEIRLPLATVVENWLQWAVVDPIEPEEKAAVGSR